MIETYRIEAPQYDWNTLETDEQLEAVISTPQLCSEPYGIQYFIR